MLDMPRPRPPHLHRETTRHGSVVWYVRIGKGARVRLRSPYGSPEFSREYLAAVAGESPAQAPSEPQTGSLLWNGGSPGLMIGQLITQDGDPCGSHCCSHEGFMPGDLGVVADTRNDRHEGFRKIYPDGYRMEFVGHAEIDAHQGLQKAFAAYTAKYPPEKASA